MQIHRTYQLSGYTTGKGYDRIDNILRECAVLHNACKEERVEAWNQGVSIGYKQQQAQLTEIREQDFVWSQVSVQVARGVLRRVDHTFQSFFRRCKAGETPGFPRWKSRHRYSTISLAEAGKENLKWDGRNYWLKVKGLPNIKLSTNRPLPNSSQLRGITITHRGRNLRINLTYLEDATPLPQSVNAVGLDMGIADRIHTSDGEVIPRRTPDPTIRDKHRRVSSCKKGSKTRRKRVKTLANAHRRERVRNRNHCHQITTGLVNQYGLIAVENLNIEGMTASASGTVENPGKNVAQKRGLNRSIQEQSWGILLNQLSYKAEWAGRTVVEVDPKYTSQKCSECGERGLRQGKTFTCIHCEIQVDADLNGARNILKRGLERVNAGGNEPATEPYPAGVTTRNAT